MTPATAASARPRVDPARVLADAPESVRGALDAARPARLRLADALAARALAERAFGPSDSGLEDFIEHFEDAPWWDPASEVDEILSSTGFAEGFRRWMPLRLDFALDLLNREIDEVARGDRLTVFRAIRVAPDWPSTVRPGAALGRFWSLGVSHLDLAAHQGSHDLPVEAVLSAGCAFADVDWWETMRARVDYLNADAEAEVRLRPDATVNLIASDPEIPAGAYRVLTDPSQRTSA